MTTNTYEIHQTNNYDQFKYMGTNREVDDHHVQRLKVAIAEYPEALKAQPILVNENMEIIDGQHRLQALKELRLPVSYTIVPGMNAHDARQMNILHKNWTRDDYARSYAAAGNRNYQTYLQFAKLYSEVTPSIVINYLVGSRKFTSKQFRHGELVIDDIQDGREALDHLAELIEINPVFRLRSYASALLQIWKIKGYDTKRMVEKASKYSDIVLKHVTLSNDAHRSLEELYNYRTTEEYRVRLF